MRRLALFMQWLIVTAACLVFLHVLTRSNRCNILIINGTVIDGTGKKPFVADVAIRDGRIAAIGTDLGLIPDRLINAKGLIICPGFIDVHTHIEGDEVNDPLAASFIYDGVTTVVTGNCGSSNIHTRAYLQWIDSLNMSVNVATLVGHNDIRKAVMGRANRDATPDEMKRMLEMTEQAMRDGAFGLSTGLIYIPGTYTKTPEIVALARVAAKYNGIYASHMRDEGDSITQAINEALTVGQQADIPVQISHFKVSGQQNWGRSKEALSLVETARQQGLDVSIDQYPYTASSTSLSTLLPDDVLADGQDSIVARLSRPAVRGAVKSYMLQRLQKRRLQHFSFAVIAYFTADTTLNGLSVEEANVRLGRPNVAAAECETVMDIITRGGASAVFHGMDEQDIKYIMQYPFNMFASDASIRIMNSGVPHPRGYGTNARVLARYVREQKVLPLEEAIRRMTSLPARKFSLDARGTLSKGLLADVLVFDAANVNDMSTFQQPHAYSTGFVYVIVNGELVVDQNKHTGRRPGMALYHRTAGTAHQ